MTTQPFAEKNPRIERGLKSLYERVRPDAGLEARTLLAAAPSAPREPGSTGARLVSRRVLVAGAATCAAAAGLAIAFPAIVGPMSERSAFGLVIAGAEETTDPIAVEATGRGLMPRDDRIGGGLALMLNLAARGDGIRSITYRIEDSPVATTENPSVHQPQDTYETVHLMQESEGANGPDGSERHLAQELPESVTIDYERRPGSDDYQPVGRARNYVLAEDGGAIWQADPTLQLMRAWLDLAVTPNAYGEQCAAAHKAYVAAFEHIAEDREELLAWLRTIYVLGFELTAEQLEQARLVAEAHLADGSTSSRSYRIALADNHEQVLEDRFEALVALDASCVDKAVAEQIPWQFLPVPTDAQIAADARLSAPIFTIEDVTAA